MTANRTVLVDNATLSGVGRLLGHSKIVNLNNVENDILCFEKLVTAILFSDRIICVDDYKEKYRSDRTKRFKFVDFLEYSAQDYERISREAADFAGKMTFCFDGAKPAGDVVAFFESLRIDPQLRWDVFVSSEYLTLSLLVKDTRATHYETGIDSVFRSENANTDAVFTADYFQPKVFVQERPEIANVKDLVQSFAADNSNYSGTASRSMLDRCVFGYGWAAERSYFYNSIAAQHGADAFLAPLRDAFCESCCRLDSPSQTDSLLNHLKNRSQDTLSKIVDASGRAKFAIKLPFFTAYLISKTDNPSQALAFALDLRNTREFRECRTILLNLTHLDSPSRYAEINSILRLLEQSCSSLLKKYSVSSANGPQVSFSLGLTGFNVSTSLKFDQLFSAYRNRPFSRLFRNIAQDMLSIERLGGLYNKLCSSINEHNDAARPRISVTPRFMEYKENEHGRPV